MNKRAFRILMAELEHRVEVEGKRSPSWLMGYLQGKGKKKLTGYQVAALVDLLLVPLEKKQLRADAETDVYKNNELSEPESAPEKKKESEVKASNSLLRTLAQR